MTDAPTLNRLERRTALLRGKRAGAFDRDQYYLERAKRAKVARKARARLRRMRPVVLVTPRWSQARSFLDDLATDLMIGSPAVRARTLSLHPLEGRTPHQSWSWLVLAVQEFCQLPLEGPAWQVVSRRGFRHVMRELFERADRGERRCLMVHGLEHLHVEALRDLIDVFQTHLEGRVVEARFNLLLAGSIDAPHFEFEPGDRLNLPDFADYEAVEALVEALGPFDTPRLRSLVDQLGGVPALLDWVSERPASIGPLLGDRQALWRELDRATEVRQAWDIVTGDAALAARIERIALEGPQVPDPTRDDALVRAGIVRFVGTTDRNRRSVLRAPFFLDLI